MCVFLSVYIYVHVGAGSHSSQKASGALRLELQIVVSPTWALGIKCGSFGRKASVLKHWMNSQAPICARLYVHSHTYKLHVCRQYTEMHALHVYVLYICEEEFWETAAVMALQALPLPKSIYKCNREQNSKVLLNNNYNESSLHTPQFSKS